MEQKGTSTEGEGERGNNPRDSSTRADASGGVIEVITDSSRTKVAITGENAKEEGFRGRGKEDIFLSSKVIHPSITFDCLSLSFLFFLSFDPSV